MNPKTTKPLKKLLAAAVLLLTCMSSFAQLTVESFEIDPSDMDARTYYPIKDKNNKNCALIKLFTNLNSVDFDFDAGSIGIEKVEQKNGAIWIYLPGGAQRISMTHKNFEKGVTNFEFPTGALKESTVYTMQLRSATVRTVVEDELSTNHLIILCSTPGATVSINKIPYTFNDKGIVDITLKYGNYQYVIEAGEWYHSTAGNVTIKKGPAERKEVSLKPKFGKLTITTTPEGADIFIDGTKQEQKSPLTVERILSGEHKIRAIKEMYKPSDTKVTISDGKDEAHVVTLEPNFAEITLISPQGGTIFVDDAQKGTSRWSGKLVAGVHSLEVQKKSHRTRKQEIDVVAGKNQEITLPTMEPIYGNLDVVSIDVIDATITIDGKLQNEKTPYIFEKLLIGEHSVTLAAEGYKTQTKSVEVIEGKTASVKFTMEEAEKVARLTIRSNVRNAAVFVDGKSMGTPPVSLSDIPLIKGTAKTVSVSVTATGYDPYLTKITLQPGDNEVSATLKETPTGTLRASANIPARVEVDGKYEGYTPATISNVPVGQHAVNFSASGYKPDKKSIYVTSGENSVQGYLKPKVQSTFFVDYQMSLTAPGGFSLGYCQRFGGYLQFKGGLMNVSADELAETANSMSSLNLRKEDVSELEKTYFRRAYTGGLMLRIASWLYAYGGLGLGQYGVSYKFGEHDGKSVYYTPQMIEGIEWEAGAKIKMSVLTTSLGYNAIAGSKFGELHFGAGLAFNETTVKGFAGSDDRHKAFGKFHFRGGYTIGGLEGSSMESLYHFGMHYNNSRAFAINGELETIFGDKAIAVRLGMYSSYFIGDHFAIDYGLGYQGGEFSGEETINDYGYSTSSSTEFNQPYFKVGASLMFNGNSWGGFNYSYTQGFGSGSSPKFFTHNISYTVGQFPTLVIGGVTLTIGLIALASAL